MVPQKWDDIDNYLENGDFIRVRGEAQWDTFENVLVIMGKDIGKKEHCRSGRTEARGKELSFMRIQR